MVRGLTLCLVATLVLSCAGASAPVKVVRGTRIQSSSPAAETDAVLAAVEQGLRQELVEANGSGRGGIRRVVLTGIDIEGPLAMVTGCGTFYEPFIPERYAILAVATKEAESWRLHSWEVVTDGLHGPRETCW